MRRGDQRPRSERDADTDGGKAKLASRDVQGNLCRSAAVIKSLPPLQIPRGMSYPRYEASLVQYGD